jgi:anti-anti-sigma factor
MQLYEEKREDTLVLSLVGKMDAVTVSEFSRLFEARIEEGGTRFVLDLGRLVYISSAGLRGVLSAFKKTEARQGTFLLCGLNGLVRETFQLSGFLAHFKTYENVDEAMADT